MMRRVLFPLLFVSVVGCTTSSSQPDPKNELPFGFVDEPANGSAIDRNVSAHGWALDDGSVVEVRMFLDNHFVARTAVNEQRPDVTKAYPRYAHGNDSHGWSLIAPLAGDVATGPHTLMFQAVDNLGASRDIATVNVDLH
jgi:hypothetical protein